MGPNKLACYITLGWKVLPGMNTLAYWAHFKLQTNWSIEKMTISTALHFLCNLWMGPNKLEYYITLGWKGLPGDKHSSLLCTFWSYKENEELRNWPLGLYRQHLIFFVTYKSAQLARTVHYTRLESLTRGEHSSLLGPFLSYKQIEVLRKWLYPQHFIFFVTYELAQIS